MIIARIKPKAPPKTDTSESAVEALKRQADLDYKEAKNMLLEIEDDFQHEIEEWERDKETGWLEDAKTTAAKLSKIRAFIKEFY